MITYFKTKRCCEGFISIRLAHRVHLEQGIRLLSFRSKGGQKYVSIMRELNGCKGFFSI